MKNNIKILSTVISIVICLQLASKGVSSEPFVVLEYRNNQSNSFEISKNPFLSDQNFSKKHKVKKNERLSDIILKNYGVKNFNKDVLSLSIVHLINMHLLEKIQTFCMRTKLFIFRVY